MPIKLRDYQEEALFAVDQSPDQRIYNPYIELPTGSGKTIIFGEGARRRGCRTLIFAHTDELIQQAYDKLHTVWPEAEIGIVKADRNEVDAEVIIGSVQTLSRPARLRELKKDFGFIVTDEVHHSAAPSYLRIYDYFELPRKETLSLGVTATPFRGDRKPLEAFSGPVYRKLIKEMIEAGWLCDLRGIAVDTSIDLDEVRMFGEDFLESDLSRVVNSPNRNELIVEAYLKYARDRKLTLCFTVDVQHALDLAETFREAGISAEAIHGKMGVEERRKILERFHNQETKVITNCQVLTEGYDEPGIDCIILGRPTMSILLHYQ
ncbi:MAG: DEAD/DEAH box helicase, partial [Candidatus Aenigmarchaeota archaeon]|nr:DEAD/DEAH box helicase [Candidatus Aenigmarchaeota archaeon]